MNVREVIQLPSFEDSQTIAGIAGLDNQVTSAMVLEATDIESWGREGQMLITSFYALESLSECELIHFFGEIARIGISAIVFKPERLLAEAPARMIELCEEHAIPLILIKKDTSYESLLLDVMGHVLDSNMTLLNRFFEVHRQTMAFALKRPSVLQILLRLRSIIHANLTFFDATKNLRTSTDPGLAHHAIAKLIALKPGRYRTNQYFDAWLTYDDAARRATAARIPSSDGHDYYLIIHAASAELSPIDIMATENVISLLQMEVLKQNAVKRKVFFRNNNLVHDLLLGHVKGEAAIGSALEELGIGQHPLFEILQVRIEAGRSLRDRYEDILRTVRQRLAMICRDFAYFEANDRITFVHNFRSEGARFGAEGIAGMLAELDSIPDVPGLNYLAAISSIGGREELPRLNGEVMDIIRFFDGDRYPRAVMSYDDLGIYKIFMQAHDMGQLAGFVDPRVRRLHEGSPDLFRTALTLCEENLNYHECARILFVHPKTVRYRAGRIGELYGLDLRNPDDRLQIALAGRIYRLIGAPAAAGAEAGDGDA
ncbi:MAG: PucR family transcriptional regulator [Collinsella sp.]|nr:PucR family transcriptional regulator [Collinsella sp.]